MSIDPDTFDEIRDPIAEDETEVVDEGDITPGQPSSEGEEKVIRDSESDVDSESEPSGVSDTEETIDESAGEELDS